MRQALKKCLIELSSKKIQVDYCINGNEDKYIIPYQIFDSTHYNLKIFLQRSKYVLKLSKENLNTLKILLSIIEKSTHKIDFDTISNEELILHNQQWLSVRKKAKEALIALNTTYQTDSHKR